MSPMPAPYDAAEPATSCRITEAPEITTAVVVQHDFPMYDMPALMDGTFSHLTLPHPAWPRLAPPGPTSPNLAPSRPT